MFWRSLHLIRPDAVEALGNETFRRALSWYYAVLLEDQPAKLHIAKAIEVPRDIGNLRALDLESLWRVHEDLGRVFESLWREVRGSGIAFAEFKRRYGEAHQNLVDLAAEIARRLLKSCRFCEWRCGVDRASGARGFCRLDSKTYVHSWFLHVGEEAPLVPSGTIFYGSCNFRCVYCQNWDISQENPYGGVEVSPHHLTLIQRELKEQGARNINHVGGDPTPNIHSIVESMRYLDVNVAQIWNSNFYMSEEAMKILVYLVDLWLPDFKYGNNGCAKRLSSVPNYVDVVGRNHVVASRWGDMIIRHLVLPNHVNCCSKPVLEWIARNLPKDRVLVNIMDQYRPEYKAYQFKEIARRVYREELEEVYGYAEGLGILWRDISR